MKFNSEQINVLPAPRVEMMAITAYERILPSLPFPRPSSPIPPSLLPPPGANSPSFVVFPRS